MNLTSIGLRRFAKFSKKGTYVKVLIPNEAKEVIQAQSTLGKECLEAFVLNEMAGAMNGLVRHVIMDPAERRRAMKEYAPAILNHD